MSAIDRKIKRAASKKIAKELKKNVSSLLEDAVKAKMESYGKLPGNCTACDEPFDKNDREQVFSWTMQIYEKDNIYNLFCPGCYQSEFGDDHSE